MRRMILNLGSGINPKKECLNFDPLVFVDRYDRAKTDVIGIVQNLPFKPEVFDKIYSFHFIEHLYLHEAIQMLQDCFSLLRRGGKLITEGPCVLGGYDLYVIKEKNVRRYIDHMFSPPSNQVTYGNYGAHHHGWTGPILAEEMTQIGFVVTHIGKGLSHGMGHRDFRVEGVKPL